MSKLPVYNIHILTFIFTMEISPIGFIYIFVLIFLFVRKKQRFETLLCLCVLVEVFVEMGYVIKIGGVTFLFTSLIEYALCFYCIIHFKQVIKTNNTTWLLLIASYILPVLLLAVYPSQSWVTPPGVRWDDVLFEGETLVHPEVNGLIIKVTFLFIIYTIVVKYAYSVMEDADYKRVLRRLSKGIDIFLCIGLVELFYKNVAGGNGVWGETLEFLFGSSDFTVFEERDRGGIELSLFTKEASHYAYSLFLAALIKLANNIVNRNKTLDLTILICLVLNLLSTSFSSILFVVAFLFLFFMYRWGMEKPKYAKWEKVIVVSIITFVLSFSTMILESDSDNAIFERISIFMDDYSDFFSTDLNYNLRLKDGSAQVRFLSVIQTLMTFWTRPLFGLSLNSTGCHGATAAFLEGVGIVGLFMWVKFYFYSCPLRQQKNIEGFLYLGAIVVYLFVNLLNSLVLRPFNQFVLVIIVISFIYVYSKKDDEKINSIDDTTKLIH